MNIKKNELQAMRAKYARASSKSQARYKRNYDARLRKQKEKVYLGDQVYLRIEKRDETQTRHKLAAFVDGPYPVVGVRGNTVVIERPDRSVERVNRDRVAVAPQERTSKEVEAIIRPMTD